MLRKKKNLKLFGKRGNVILDGVMVLIVLFVFALFSIVGFKIFGEINTDLQKDSDLGSVAKSNVNSLNSKYNQFMDAAFILAVVLLWGLVVVASFMIDSHPLFFVFTIILLVIVLYVGGVMSNTYIELVEEDDFGDISVSMPKTHFIMSHLVESILVIAFSVVIALYSKSQQGGF